MTPQLIVSANSAGLRAGKYAYYGVATYIATPKKDGSLVWRKHEQITANRTTLALAQKDAAEYAANHGLACNTAIRHNSSVVGGAK